ncbi:Glutaredoxin-1 [Taenia crassiceps]|uniref:Glutaredoxin-1 n=1 Tax=Taenia crassiceps TaxID=6207 RepID=A0ABR4QI79_9CEST
MSGNLDDEVENFFAEVDAIAFNDVKDQDTAPRTNWIVQVDSKSNLPFYYNFVTKETTWNIPDEYQSYLDEYKTYLQHKNDQSDLKKEEKKVPVLILPEGNARKRRRIKRAFMRANAGKASLSDTPVEFLSEYIAYSDSSSEDESLDSKRSSQAAMINEPMEVTSQTPESLTGFIGPQLPSSPPKCESSSLKPDELSKLLMDKFSTLLLGCDKLPRLQVAYIQFSTRFEDWKAGCLSEAHYREKLEEVSNFLGEYERRGQFEAVDGSPPDKAHAIPLFQVEPDTLSQTGKNSSGATSLEVSENKSKPNSPDSSQRPGTDVQMARCDLNADNSLAVHSQGIKPTQKLPMKNIGSDVLVADGDVPKSPEKSPEISAYVQKEIQSAHVVLFIKSCSFTSNDLHVVDIGERADCAKVQDYLESITGARTVPRIFIGKKSIGGCSDLEQLHRKELLGELLAQK